MIDLTLYPKIQQDIQSKTTSLIPLVVINPDDPIYISTQKGLFDNDKFFEDVGLSLSSIKEGIDIRNRKFQINNLSFSVNNYPKNNIRISDLISNMGLVNKKVKVYYKTQSCSLLSDSIKIYEGKIKRLTHDEKVVKFQLEDSTQTFLSKKVPISNIKSHHYAYNKDYIGKPIPITYGEVDKAPAIPIVNRISVDNDVDIKIIADDVLNPDRDLEIGGHRSSNQDVELPAANLGGTNPLFIYKGDYFQVLENFNSTVLQEDSEDWIWEDEEQYVVTNNWLEIRKKYSGRIPLNPPAYNEFQCTKIRFPNQCLSLGNPEGDAITDDNGVALVHQQVPIKSPDLAIDNPYSLPLSTRYNDNHQTSESYYDTKAEIPDNTVDVLEGDELIVSDFRIHRNSGDNSGIWFPRESKGSYPQKLFSWLNINMHNLNEDLESPRVVYKQLPRVSKIKDRINQALFFNVFEDGWDADDGSIDYSTIPNYLESTSVASHLDLVERSDYFRNNFHKDGSNAPYQDEGGYAMDNLWYNSTTGEGFGNQVRTEKLQWYYDLNDDSPVPQGVFMKFLVKNQYRKPRDEGGIGCDFVYVSMENGSFSVSEYTNKGLPLLNYGQFGQLNTSSDETVWVHGNGSWINPSTLMIQNLGANRTDSSVYFNLFDPEEDIPPPWQNNTYNFLFYSDDFAEYAPISVTQKGFLIEDKPNVYFTSYKCKWNGVLSGENTGNGNDTFWDINYWLGYGHSGLKTKSSHLFNNDERNWVIWVKSSFGNVGIQYPDQDANPFLEGQEGFTCPSGVNNIRMTPNSMFPTTHILESLSNSNDDVIVDFHGYIEPSFPNSFTISDFDENNNAADKRVGLVFPLGDLDVSDNIKSDTFFHGKIVCNFLTENNETTNSSNARFVLNVGSIDTVPLDEEGSIEVDFETLDDGYDSDGNLVSNVLIDKTLSECHSLNQQMWSSSSTDIPQVDNDGNIISNESNSNYIDQDNGLIKVNQFWDINNYNAFALIFRLDNDNIGSASLNSSQGADATLFADIHSAGLIHYTIFEKALDSSLYVNCDGRVNSLDDTIDIGGFQQFKYSGDVYDSNAQNYQRTIHKPSDIIYHFIEKELGLIEEVDINSIINARSQFQSPYAFSVKDEIEAKKLIEDFSKSTMLFPKFKAGNSLSYAFIKNNYEIGDEDFIIKSQDIIKHSFTRTPIEDIYTIVNVKYKKDYEEDTFIKETGYIDGYDVYGNGDGTDTLEGRQNGYSYNYLGLTREDNILEFESEFIRDRNTALELREFLYINNCNQHNIFKITLPIKYIMLEVGDIVRFDSLVNNMKAYGEDYTQPVSRNGQTITPLFIVKSIDKKPNSISVQLYQLHNMERTFDCALGSITRMLSSDSNSFRSMEDWSLLDNFLNDGEKYYTSVQKNASDLTADGTIGYNDLDMLQDLMNVFFASNITAEDIDGNGVVDISEIVLIMQYILGVENWQQDFYDIEGIGDTNQDGIINVVDVINYVNTILGEG